MRGELTVTNAFGEPGGPQGPGAPSMPHQAPPGDYAASELLPPYGGSAEILETLEPMTPTKVRTKHLQDWKEENRPWAMLTSYDQLTAQVFDEAGVPVLLVGDSAANNILGYETTLGVTVEEMIPFGRAVARATKRAFVVMDLPFGSYHESTEQAVRTACRMMKETGAHGVKLEGGAAQVDSVKAIVDAGVPVMAHIGFTPQAEHALGGYRVQGRGDSADVLMDDALALQEAGAFSVVLEMVPSSVAANITKSLSIPTIGIGAGSETDAQVLVWQDAFGLRGGKMPRFVKQFADLRGALIAGTRDYIRDVETYVFPGPEHSFED